MVMNVYSFPIGTDDTGRKFQWKEDDNVTDCSKCCFWKEKCTYHELNRNKKGECFGSGYFRYLV